MSGPRLPSSFQWFAVTLWTQRGTGTRHGKCIVYFGAAIGSMSSDGTTVGASATFSVTVTADKSVRSVDMYVGPVGSAKQSFCTPFVGGDTWQADLQIDHPDGSSLHLRRRCQAFATNCTNDPLGCWSVDHGVVDLNWTTRSFSNNIPWDYGYYGVSDTGAHIGSASSDALDMAAGTLQIDFTTPVVGDSTTALGYSYIDDPNFMHCQEAMSTEG